MNTNAVHIALKQEEKSLVGQCGGIEIAAGLVGLKKSQVSRITDPKWPYHFSAMHVAILEAHCGNPRVTRLLAELRGRELVERDELLPLLSSEVEDWPNEKMQAVAAFSGAVVAYLRGQRSPRLLNTVMAAARRSHEVTGAILQSARVMAARRA